MATDLTKIAFDSRLNYLKKFNSVSEQSFTFGATYVEEDIDHGLTYIPFWAVGVDLFNNGVIWSNEYVWEYAESSAAGSNAPPNFVTWMTTDTLTVEVYAGSGTNQQSGDSTIYYGVYLDYGS